MVLLDTIEKRLNESQWVELKLSESWLKQTEKKLCCWSSLWPTWGGGGTQRINESIGNQWMDERHGGGVNVNVLIDCALSCALIGCDSLACPPLPMLVLTTITKAFICFKKSDSIGESCLMRASKIQSRKESRNESSVYIHSTGKLCSAVGWGTAWRVHPELEFLVRVSPQGDSQGFHPFWTECLGRTWLRRIEHWIVHRLPTTSHWSRSVGQVGTKIASTTFPRGRMCDAFQIGMTNAVLYPLRSVISLPPLKKLMPRTWTANHR